MSYFPPTFLSGHETFDLMIDIESGALRMYDSPVLTIGIVAFVPRVDVPGTFIEPVLHNRVPRPIVHWDINTIGWWVEQGVDAWKRLCAVPAFDNEDEVVGLLQSIVGDPRVNCVWANHVGFDLVNLWTQATLESAKSGYKWRDLPSLYEAFAPATVATLREILYGNRVMHDALEDATAQARLVQVCKALVHDIELTAAKDLLH